MKMAKRGFVEPVSFALMLALADVSHSHHIGRDIQPRGMRED
jgi:hypothetical protein